MNTKLSIIFLLATLLVCYCVASSMAQDCPKDLKESGDTCTSPSDCKYPLRCDKDDGEDEGECAAPKYYSRGEECNPSLVKMFPQGNSRPEHAVESLLLFCSPFTGKVEFKRSVGEGCSTTTAPCDERYGFCYDNVCTAYNSQSEDGICGLDAGFNAYSQCSGELACTYIKEEDDPSSDYGTCVVPQEKDQDCSDGRVCKFGLQCVTLNDDGDQECQSPLEVGDSCGGDEKKSCRGGAVCTFSNTDNADNNDMECVKAFSLSQGDRCASNNDACPINHECKSDEDAGYDTCQESTCTTLDDECKEVIENRYNSLFEQETSPSASFYGGVTDFYYNSLCCGAKAAPYAHTEDYITKVCFSNGIQLPLLLLGLILSYITFYMN